MIGRLNYSEGCNKCGSTDFIREAQAKSNEYITFHLCRCGNVMISIKRRDGYLPTPESHDPLTKQLMEEAAEVLGLPVECAVATEEEFKALTDICMNVLNNCINVFKESIDLDDEENQIEEYTPKSILSDLKILEEIDSIQDEISKKIAHFKKIHHIDEVIHPERQLSLAVAANNIFELLTIAEKAHDEEDYEKELSYLKDICEHLDNIIAKFSSEEEEQNDSLTICRELKEKQAEIADKILDLVDTVKEQEELFSKLYKTLLHK